MSSGFNIALDLVQLHREVRTEVDGRVSRGSPASSRCLHQGAFLAAFAAGEEYVRQGSKRRGLSRPDESPASWYTLGSAGMVSAFADGAGVTLAARARVAPRGNTRIWKWTILTATGLQDYLRDAYKLRNRIAHTGSTAGVELASQWFALPTGARTSANLMMVEGLLQAAQDIAYMLATEDQQRAWTWCLPLRTSTGRMTVKMASDERFPLPVGR